MIIRVCGRDTIAEYCDEEITHLLSIQDPRIDVTGLRPRRIKEKHHLLLRFADVENPADPDAPTYDELFKVVLWLDEVEPVDGLLVHCQAGICRSPAVACMALAYLNPDASFRDCMDEVARGSSHGIVHPNRLVVALADEILGAGGEMVAEIAAWRRGDFGWDGA